MAEYRDSCTGCGSSKGYKWHWVKTMVIQKDILNALGQDIPIKRIGRPEEFAPIVTFLCSDMASYITGNSINIDGGLIKSLF